MISVVIPTYKKTEQLIDNLKSNLPYISQCEIIIVNDDPDKSIKTELNKFPSIHLIENKENLGFSKSIHKGIMKTSNSYIMLLNNDVTLQDNSYINALSELKKNSNIFAISFAQKEKGGDIVGKNMFYWKNGFFQHAKSTNQVLKYNGWAEGGSCLINKSIYLQLGGFDPVYSPFYWEDIDLSYRAWKADYQVIFNPKIQVIHHHESTTMSFFSKEYINTIAFRNQLFFIWKNIGDKSLLFNHIVYLPFFLISQIFKGNFSMIKGFFSALYFLPSIIKQRHVLVKKNIYSDISIINKFHV